MAIQVSGTSVINNSRQLQNIASLDATTAATVAAAAGGGFPSFVPTDTPDATFTSTGTWTKPGTIGDSDFVTFFLTGGGGGAGAGNWAGGGSGANAVLFTSNGASLPSSMTITIGAAGSGSSSDIGGNGGDSSVTISGTTFTAEGGTGASGSSARYTPNTGMISLIPSGNFPYTNSTPAQSNGGNTDTLAAGIASIYGGGGGGSTSANQVLPPGFRAGGASTYSGDGGDAQTNGDNGGLHGGGGGGSMSGAGGNGGAGTCRIYYG
tara:strand:- start:1617 stop:2411 length:795 start_codon:yes stop_codon:yes gene_type:complete